LNHYQIQAITMQHKMRIEPGGTKTDVLILHHHQQPVFRERVAIRTQSQERAVMETALQATKQSP
jgi:hypothetical protein